MLVAISMIEQFYYVMESYRKLEGLSWRTLRKCVSDDNANCKVLFNFGGQLGYLKKKYGGQV